MEVIVSAKTVEDAVALGAKQLGKLVSEVEYEVVEEAKKGFLGMFGTEASVKVISKYTVQDKIVEFLNTLIKDMGVDAKASIVKIEENLASNGTLEKDIHVDIEGKGLGMIIGRHGDVLDSIQYLCNIIAGRFPKSEDKHEYIRIIVDVENYRRKRSDTLKSLARRMADRVLNSGRNYTLEPMSGYERRIIHSEVQNIKGVHTYSIGTEGDRRVVIAYGEESGSTEE